MTRAPLEARLEHLARTMRELSHQDPPVHTGDGLPNGALGAFLRDHAVSLDEFAHEVREERGANALPSCVECPECGAKIDTREAVAL